MWRPVALCKQFVYLTPGDQNCPLQGSFTGLSDWKYWKKSQLQQLFSLSVNSLYKEIGMPSVALLLLSDRGGSNPWACAPVLQERCNCISVPSKLWINGDWEISLSAKWEPLSLAITHCLLSPLMNVYKVLGEVPMQSATYEPPIIKCFIMYLFKPMLTLTSGKLQSLKARVIGKSWLSG